MNRYAILDGATVSNIAPVAPGTPHPEGSIQASADTRIGDRYDPKSGSFSRPPAPPAPVPASVNQRQARRALRAAGKLQAVEDAMQAMPGEAGEDARIDWERAPTIERASPLVAAMGAMLGMDDTSLDDLFRHAATL